MIRRLSPSMALAARASAIALLLLCAACGTTSGQRQLAAQRLEAVWASENQATRAQFGERMVKATPDQAFRAARAALIRVGLEVDDHASPPAVVGQKTYPAGSFSWSPAIRQLEEERMRTVFVEALGPVGGNLRLAPTAEDLVGTAKLKAAPKGQALLAVDFRTQPVGGGDCPQPCLLEMPPAALRAAYYEYWAAFDDELAEVKAEDEAKAAASRKRSPPARKARPSKPPKAPGDWTLPPKDWRPPPR